MEHRNGAAVVFVVVCGLIGFVFAQYVDKDVFKLPPNQATPVAR